MKIQLSEAEWKIMNAVWERNPASVRDVMDVLGRSNSWAYSTIKTMMSRLVEKGALATRKRANTSLFEPLLSKKRARQAALRSLLDRAFEGAVGPFVSFLVDEETLSDRDRSRLEQMLKEEGLLED